MTSFKFWKRKREKEASVQPLGDPEGVARAERALHESQTSWKRTKTEIWEPLEELRARNNVTGLARSIVNRNSGGSNREGTA